ncbi:MAG: hypothetical protein M0Z38_07080 [Deltaproteobacteria bacterium]|nr:hypothetical protein [Deltaproteobacteria bacterium]
MRVRAIAFGEYRGKRKPGTEFEFEGKPSGKWMEPVDDAARVAFKKAGLKVPPKPVDPPPPPPGGEGDKRKTGAGPDGAADNAPPPPGGSTGDKNVI